MLTKKYVVSCFPTEKPLNYCKDNPTMQQNIKVISNPVSVGKVPHLETKRFSSRGKLEEKPNINKTKTHNDQKYSDLLRVRAHGYTGELPSAEETPLASRWVSSQQCSLKGKRAGCTIWCVSRDKGLKRSADRLRD